MRTFALVTILAIGLMLITLALWPRPDKPTVAMLEGQLSGAHCGYQFEYGEECRPRQSSFFHWLLLSQAECDLWAVKCLGEIKTPAAQQQLINVLTTKTDVETCDGVLPVRSLAVGLLGDGGQPAAIPPLERHLASKPRATLSAGASGCSARPEPEAEIREALRKLQSR
jgi:PBS lyase HEAT-like repeat